MAVGNPGTSTVNKARLQPAGSASDCQELQQTNTERRQELTGRTRDQTLVGPNGTGRGTTISSVKRTPIAGGTTKIRSAHNNIKAFEKCPKTLSPGGSAAVRKGAPGPCGYVHPSPTMQKSGHAEARMLDELLNAKPQRMTFSIDWRKRKGKPSKMPCTACHRMMCRVMECGHAISLCSKKGKPVALSAEHCDGTPEARTKLVKAIDG